MAHLTTSVEYGIHCLLWLVDAGEAQPSSRDLAELQGVSPSFVAKIFPRLEKAGLVVASQGVRGGYRLARAPQDITVLDIVDAIEGPKPLFECQEVRWRCAVFDGQAPPWATDGVCAIHAVMQSAEQAMRDALARETLAGLACTLACKAPAAFGADVQQWLSGRGAARGAARAVPMTRQRRDPSP